MKLSNNLKVLALIMVPFLLMQGCKKNNKELFSIAFITDIHLQPELNAVSGFRQALDSVNELKPDFILTGGDLIMDALRTSYGRADSLYNLYIDVIQPAGYKVYNTMGNHEIYGTYSQSGADPSHPEYGEKMYEKRFGSSYYSFVHEGWKFIILNSIEDGGNDSYFGLVDSAQVDWLRDEISNTDNELPIVVCTHIPLLTSYTQKFEGSTVANDSTIVVYNAKEVLDLFADHNLKLVLQGHLHIVEDAYIDGVHFITGGAICGSWWRGPNRSFEEGFIHLTFYKDDFRWKFIDYDWEAHGGKITSYFSGHYPTK